MAARGRISELAGMEGTARETGGEAKGDLYVKEAAQAYR